MPHWAGWIIVAVICAIAEMLTPSFFMAWFGVGAVFAALLAATGLGPAWQMSGFIAVSLALVLSTKRLTSKWFKADREARTNVYALEGASGLVTREIPENGTGQVRVGHEIWTATSYGGGKVPAGVTVTVVKVDGVHLVVRAADSLT